MVDQRIDTYSGKTKSRRWSLTAFEYTLDTARVNAQTIYAINNNNHPRKIDSYDAARELGEALIAPLLLRRYNGRRKGKCLDVQRAIKECLDNYEIPHEPLPKLKTFARSSSMPSSRKVCAECRENNTLLEKELRKNTKFLPRTTSRCKRCNSPICKDHSQWLCNYCV